MEKNNIFGAKQIEDCHYTILGNDILLAPIVLLLFI